MSTYTFSLPYASVGDTLSVTIDSDNNLSQIWQTKSFAYLRSMLHNHHISPRYRLTVLNADETPCYRIPDQDVIVGGSYSENYQNGQRRSLSFSLVNNKGQYTPSVDKMWVGTRILFEIGIEVADVMTLWFKKGIFVVDNARPAISASEQTVEFSCVDKFGLLESRACSLADTLTVYNGAKIEDVIRDVLMMNMGNGYIIDPKPIIYHHTFKDKQVPLDVSEQVGSTYGSLLLQLADILSAEMFYNSEGQLVVVPKSEVTYDADKPILESYVDGSGDYHSLDMSLDYSSFVNKVVVTGGNVNGRICRAERINNDPASPLASSKIGLRVADVIEDSNITTDYLAEERANYELRKISILKTTQNMSVKFNPLLTVNALINVTDKFFDLKLDKFLIQSISYSLDYSGAMTLTSSNLLNLPSLM